MTAGTKKLPPENLRFAPEVCEIDPWSEKMFSCFKNFSSTSRIQLIS